MLDKHMSFSKHIIFLKNMFFFAQQCLGLFAHIYKHIYIIYTYTCFETLPVLVQWTPLQSLGFIWFHVKWKYSSTNANTPYTHCFAPNIVFYVFCSWFMNMNNNLSETLVTGVVRWIWLDTVCGCSKGSHILIDVFSLIFVESAADLPLLVASQGVMKG